MRGGGGTDSVTHKCQQRFFRGLLCRCTQTGVTCSCAMVICSRTAGETAAIARQPAGTRRASKGKCPREADAAGADCLFSV